MKLRARVLISTLSFLLSASAFAFEGHGGGYHGALPNTGYHNNGYYNNNYGSYYHNNEWYGGSVNVNTWNDGIWYDDNLNDDTNVVLGVPNEGYYDPSCQTIDDCSSGTCVLVNTCDQE